MYGVNNRYRPDEQSHSGIIGNVVTVGFRRIEIPGLSCGEKHSHLSGQRDNLVFEI